MKKLILTLAILSALICALVISVSAASTSEFGEVEIVGGMDEKSVFGGDGTEDGYTSRVVLFDGKEYHTYPAYYIFTNNVNTTTDFRQLNELATKSYGKTSLVRAEVPTNVQKVTGDIFKGYNDLKYVKFPDTLVEISGNMFYTSHGLEWTNVPRDCVSICGYAFYGCSSLKTVDMSNAQSLKRSEANQFYNCPNLEELIFPEGFEYFGGAGGGGPTFQNGLGSLKTLYLPDSVTYMGTISEMKSIGTFTVPLGVTSLKANQFSYCSGLNTLVVHKDVTSVASNAFDMTLYVREIIYTGNEGDDAFAKLTAYSSSYTSTSFTVGNHCEYYYGGTHMEDNNPCVINCTRCNSVAVPEKDPKHNELTTIVYANYESIGTKLVACQNKGCKHRIEADVDPLFVNLGFSAALYGDLMSVNYRVNDKAIKEYEAITGERVNYGVFAVKADNIGKNDIFDENGVERQGVIAADITDSGFGLFNLKITGFDEKQKDIDLAIGAYVGTAKDGTVKYSYLQIAPATEGEKYYFASYNDVVALLSEKNI